MKVFKVSFFLVLLTSSYHCQAMDEPEPVKQLTKHLIYQEPNAPNALSDEEFNNQFFPLVKNNFRWNKNTKCREYTTALLEFDNVNNRFQELLTHRPYHQDLNLYYKELNLSVAHLLWCNGKQEEALTKYAFMVLRPNKVVPLTNNETSVFMTYLQAMVEPTLQHHFYKLFQACENPQQFMITKGLRSKNHQKFLDIYPRCMQESITPLLTYFKNLETVHDAFLQTIISNLDQKDKGEVATKLVKILYHNQPKPSPLLTLYYALRCLSDKIDKAIPLYESILGTELDNNNYIQCPATYNILFNLYCRTVKPIKKQTQENCIEDVYSPEDYGKLKKAESCIEKAIKLSTGTIPAFFINLTSLQTTLKEYEKADKTYQKIWMVPNLKQQIGKSSYKDLTINYKSFLQLTENTKELQQIDRKKLEKIFKKNAVIANHINTIRDLEAQQKRDAEKAEKQSREAAQDLKKRQAALKQEKQKMNKSEGLGETLLPPAFPEKPMIKNTPLKKQKKEENKVVDKKPSSSPAPKGVTNCPPESVKKRPLICISELVINKRAQDIFTEFYAHYIEHRKPKVSFSDAEYFFESLDKCRLPSNNKKPRKKTLETNRATSHHKATVRPKEFGIEGAEQMVIITNLIGERPYQTDHILDMFLNIGVVPNKDPQLLTKLKQGGYLVGFE